MFFPRRAADKMLRFTVLSLDNISKSFGARKILADVSWSMPDDGRVGLVGLNGAGKSTLLKIIGGVHGAGLRPYFACRSARESDICIRSRRTWAAARCSTRRSRR